MILCVTPNPAVDRTLVVPHLTSGEVHRATQAMAAAGGKGLNAARAITTLGGEALCLGFLGGKSGELVADLAAREGLAGAWTTIEGETRTCLIIVPADGAEPTVINEPGPGVTGHDWDRLTADINLKAAGQELICINGSLPANSPLESFTQLISSLIHSNKSVWIDTSGPALEAVMSLRGVNIKVNGAEAGASLKMPVTTIETASEAAYLMRQRGANNLVITLGRHGAVMATEDGAWHASPPSVKAISNVGSGDAFLGGLLTAFARGYLAPDALRWAAAAGVANTLSVGGGLFTRSDFDRMLKSSVCQLLST